MRKEKGFTLVELLVVIAIVAVLAGAVLIAINPATMMMKARDSRRLSDMDSLVKAVNLALTDGEITLQAMNAPTTSAGPAANTQKVDGTGWIQYTLPLNKTGLSRFLAALPLDPVNSGIYLYSFESTLTDFEIDCSLEFTDNIIKMTTDGGNNPGAYEAGTNLAIIGGAAVTPTPIE